MSDDHKTLLVRDSTAFIRNAIAADPELRAVIESRPDLSHALNTLMDAFDQFAEIGDAARKFDRFHWEQVITAMRTIGSQFVECSANITNALELMNSPIPAPPPADPEKPAVIPTTSSGETIQ
jgi:hypothetical protein